MPTKCSLVLILSSVLGGFMEYSYTEEWWRTSVVDSSSVAIHAGPCGLIAIGNASQSAGSALATNRLGVH